MTRRAAILVGLAAAAAAASSCGRSQGLALECQTDEQCGMNHACIVGTCLAIQRPLPGWALEVVPLSTSPSGLFELTEAGEAAGTITLLAKVTLAGFVTPESGGSPLGAAHLVLSVPATIPGNPDLRFETDLVPPGGAGAAGTFALEVPASLVGRQGTLRVLPTGPQAFTHAPATLDVTIDPTLDVIVPSMSFTVQGRLTTAAASAKAGQLVRAYQGGEVVSTSDITTEDGSFSIAVPATRVGPTAAQAITVELAPPETAVEPSFVTTPIVVTANVDLGDVRLPAFSQANVFRFAIHAGTDDGPAVPGTIVSARTRLADDATGTTDFLRQGIANIDGIADLALVPGSTALRNYDVAIVPPTDSPNSTKCIFKLPIAAGGAPGAPAILSPVVLQRRTKLTMSVLSGDGLRPAANVMVVANLLTADASILPCATEVTTRPPTATTDARGVFSLFLDPGNYRFDLEPPAGSAEARVSVYTDDPFPPVAAGDDPEIKLTVALPPVVTVAQGTVKNAGGPVALANVRFFELTCGDTAAACTRPASAPMVRAEARTDAAGQFRAVFTTLPTLVVKWAH